MIIWIFVCLVGSKLLRFEYRFLFLFFFFFFLVIRYLSGLDHWWGFGEFDLRSITANRVFLLPPRMRFSVLYFRGRDGPVLVCEINRFQREGISEDCPGCLSCNFNRSYQSIYSSAFCLLLCSCSSDQ